MYILHTSVLVLLHSTYILPKSNFTYCHADGLFYSNIRNHNSLSPGTRLQYKIEMRACAPAFIR